MGEESEVDVSEMLQLQMSEVEMLCSMFPSPGEFAIDDPLAVGEIQQFVEGNIAYDLLQSRIGFVLKLDVGKVFPLVMIIGL